MAASGVKNVTVTNWDTLRFVWSVVSQSVAKNTSTIRWNLFLVAGSSGRISSTASKNYWVEINGKRWSGTNTIGIANNSTITLASATHTFAHEDDGSLTLSFRFSQTFDITFSGQAIGSKSGVGTGTVNSIPRVTTPTLSASSVNMGGSVTINTPRATSAFTHDLAYSFAGGSYVSIASGVATSYVWTVPDLASKIPNAISGTVTIRCITKQNGTSVGTKTVLLTAKVPASVVPTISSVACSEAVEGLTRFAGRYIQGKSKLKVSITAAGASGSTIKSYSTVFQGRTYTGNSWTSAVLTGSGTVSMVTTVTDSRGRTAKKTTSIIITAYSPPVIETFTAHRCAEDGTEAHDGGFVFVDYQYSVANLGGNNTAAASIQRKLTGAVEWETLHTFDGLGAGGSLILPDFSADSQWDLRLHVVDWFGEVAIHPLVIPTAEVILDILADGTGISFGKVAEREGTLDIDWRIRAQVGFDVLVLEQGTDLNTLLTPNTYAGKNANSGEYANCPVDTATFTLQVFPAGEVGQILQRFTTCNKVQSVTFERFYYQSAWGDWVRVSDFDGALLWSGNYYMTGDQTAVLSEPVSVQRSGIVLVFARYVEGEDPYAWHSFFIPKYATGGGYNSSGHTFMMTTNGFSVVATKYLYIRDTQIGGNDNNTLASTSNGITFNNSAFTLRYVIGV